MTKLYYTTQVMPGADIGKENPLPDFGDVKNGPVATTVEASLTKEESKFVDYGQVANILPYRMQDGYDRDKKVREYSCAVLENDHLKAVFFPQFGGKMWSLYDKDAGKDLLQVNPVFQPCNLALRNAWTSGGTEWNIGMRGHTPFTLSQLHTADGKLSDGTPVLRMYEWERIRRVQYQMDFILPEDSRFLLVRIKLINTQEAETPIYWWSNSAVVETETTRVLAPADSAFVNTYFGGIDKTSIPVVEGVDSSYSLRLKRARDFFYDIPEARRKWECTADENGNGLIHTSTDRLQGRKLFVWGNSAGGAHWQEFLSVPGGDGYIEIQAGLANTQFECLPLPGKASWEWLEAYGAFHGDPEKCHGEWYSATNHAEEVLETMLPRAKMDQMLADLGKELDKPFAVRTDGSGWAALELERLGRKETFEGSFATLRESAMNQEQAPWLELLREGTFPNQDPKAEPAAYLTQSDWIPMLEQAAETTSNHWHSWFQLGVMYFANKMEEKAAAAFEKSIALTENAWALRCLALIQSKTDMDQALATMGRAMTLEPITHIIIEYGKMLLEAGKFREYLALYATLPPAQKENGRLLALKVEALTQTDCLEEAREICLNGVEIPDIRECETLLSDMWIHLHKKIVARETGETDDAKLLALAIEKYPVPRDLDYRMVT